MSAFRVGLTGGLASGKSTVAARLAAAGFTVVDADRLVDELYLPAGRGARAVAELFGPGALAPDGSVAKDALARRIFADPESRARLEAAIHPLVRQRFAEIAAATDGVVVLEATLLVESGLASDFDLVVTVEAPERVRLLRATRRGLDPGAARARMAAQGDASKRRDSAHVVLENDGDLDRLRRATDRLIADLRSRATR